jgi:hypothetical protein
LYHENRISQVQNFVFPVPLKNIVQGRKVYLKVEKRISWASSFPLFYPRDRKVEKNFPREFSFPPSNILLFPRQYCSAGVGNGNFCQGNSLFYDIKKLPNCHFL